MTADEQIDLLRREIADLRDRLARLEAKPQPQFQVTQPFKPLQPYTVPPPPYMPYIRPQTTSYMQTVPGVDGSLCTYITPGNKQ